MLLTADRLFTDAASAVLEDYLLEIADGRIDCAELTITAFPSHRHGPDLAPEREHA